MTEKREFAKKLMSLVVPIAAQQLMMALVGVCDALMLGFINQDSLSAVSLAGQVQFIFSLFIFSITGGVSILAAQYWGINDKDTVEILCLSNTARNIFGQCHPRIFCSEYRRFIYAS